MTAQKCALFRILSRCYSVIFKAFASPPPADCQVVMECLSNYYAQHNAGQISIILSFFFGKRAGFFRLEFLNSLLYISKTNNLIQYSYV